MGYSTAVVRTATYASEGQEVRVEVDVYNTHPQYHYSFRTEIYAGAELILNETDVILSGTSKHYSALFIMPPHDVTILVWIERWSFDHYVFDYATTVIVPLYGVPEPETFHLSILVPSWAAGGYVDPGSGDYPAYSTVRLTAHPLSGYQFTGWGRDASGTSLTYNLYMSSDKNVEAYFEEVPVEEYAGRITRKELDYEAIRVPFPVQ